jgi:hypothetical protein
MEKTSEKTITTVEIHHSFFCDKCKTLIGESIEYDDGYYEELGRYERSFVNSNKGCYGLHLNLCDKCKEKMDNEIEQALFNLGFKKD